LALADTDDQFAVADPAATAAAATAGAAAAVVTNTTSVLEDAKGLRWWHKQQGSAMRHAAAAQQACELGETSSQLQVFKPAGRHFATGEPLAMQQTCRCRCLV
jgi:hypothetical protein